MPDERIVEFLHPLLKQLADAKELATKKHDDAAVSGELLKKIEQDIEFANDIFRKLVEWENEVKDQIGNITKQLDEVLEDSSSKESIHEFRFRLQFVSQKASSLKQHMTPPLQLPYAESFVAPSANSLMTTEGETVVLDTFKLKKDDLCRSFKNLNEYLQQCLRSSLIFPLQQYIKKRLLIHWWIGESRITGVTSEAQGERCLRELINEGFMVPIYKHHNPHAIDSCWIPQSVYDVVHSEGFFPNTTITCPTPLQKSDMTGSIFNYDQHNLKFERKKFTSMSGAAAVQFGRWSCSAKHHIEVENTKFLDWMVEFKNLTYLSLRGISRITELPPSIGVLTRLRILDIRACHNLVSLPPELRMLTDLMHLDASECYFLDHMPRGLASLSKLEVLKGFVVGSLRSQDPCRLSELSELGSLKKISISIGVRSVVEVGEFDRLSEFISLRSLAMTWAAGMSPSMVMTSVHVSLPPYLLKLDLRCFPERMAPDWLSPDKLSNLRRLYIRGGKLEPSSLCDSKHGVQTKWHSVKILRLRLLCTELEISRPYLEKSFPNAEHLEIYGCTFLRSQLPFPEPGD